MGPDVQEIPNIQFLHCKLCPVINCRSAGGQVLLIILNLKLKRMRDFFIRLHMISKKAVHLGKAHCLWGTGPLTQSERVGKHKDPKWALRMMLSGATLASISWFTDSWILPVGTQCCIDLILTCHPCRESLLSYFSYTFNRAFQCSILPVAWLLCGVVCDVANIFQGHGPAAHVFCCAVGSWPFAVFCGLLCLWNRPTMIPVYWCYLRLCI